MAAPSLKGVLGQTESSVNGKQIVMTSANVGSSLAGYISCMDLTGANAVVRVCKATAQMGND